MGDQINFLSSGIKKHADELRKDIAPAFEEVKTALNDSGTIEGGDFSITGTMASMAYPGRFGLVKARAGPAGG